ncbi:uncharacterized protein LOC142011080 [Carettochelys insculpta]|uniref:uncharacterized protein LOC142011080 n=1 Tax=Carettochelys insculpta TaxID=44489 RepID=UPI003EBD9312
MGYLRRTVCDLCQTRVTLMKTTRMEEAKQHQIAQLICMQKEDWLVSPLTLLLLKQIIFKSKEGPEESASEASVVLESPPGPSLQASPSAEDRPAPRRARWRTPRHHQPTVPDPQLLAIHRRQLEVAEQHLQLQERALAWRQEAWRAYMETFNRLVDYLAPHAALAAAAPDVPAPPAAPPAAPPVAVPSAVAPPPTAEGRSTEGPLEPAETRRAYLPVRPAPSQTRTGLRLRRGSRPPTPSAGL